MDSLIMTCIRVMIVIYKCKGRGNLRHKEKTSFLYLVVLYLPQCCKNISMPILMGLVKDIKNEIMQKVTHSILFGMVKILV